MGRGGVLPSVDYDSTVAFLRQQHGDDWDKIATSFAAFLRFTGTLGGDEAKAQRHIDPQAFTPRILEHRYHYWCWRQEQRIGERRKARAARRQKRRSGEEEGEECVPSGFNILKDNLREQVEGIHARVRASLPTLGDDSSSESSDGEMPEVFFSGYDWNKIKLPGDEDWGSPEREPATAHPASAPSAASPPAPVQRVPMEPSIKSKDKEVPAAAAGETDEQPQRKEREKYGVRARGFFERPFARPSDCVDDPDDDAALDAEFLRKLESTAPAAQPESSRPRMSILEAVERAALDDATFGLAANVFSGVPEAKAPPTEVDPPSPPAPAPKAKAASPTRAEPRVPVSRPGRWQVIEHSDDSDDEPAPAAKGAKGKGKGKGRPSAP